MLDWDDKFLLEKGRMQGMGFTFEMWGIEEIQS